MQERREKAPSSLSSLFPLWAVQVPVLFAPGLHSVHSPLACQARAMLLASVVGTLAQCGAEIRCLPGRGAGGGGAWILQRQALLSRPQHSSSVRDLRVPNEWQEQRNVEPFRRGVERWPLVSLLFPWVCP